MRSASKLTHYSLEEWTDYVRRLTGQSESTSMEKHLESCQSCRTTVTWLEGFAQAAAIDSSISVPAGMTSRAKALFSFKKPDSNWIKSLKKLAADLVADSGLDPLPVGLRAAGEGDARSVRHLTFRAGDYGVDLQIEPTGAGVSEIVGQIGNRSNEHEQFDGALVQVIAGGRTVGETETNRFGEFVVDRPMRSGVTLRIALPKPGFSIEMPLRTRKRN